MTDLTPYRRLLIFGGSFDPPHRAHVELPRLARDRIGADALLYIPTGQAPHKRHQNPTATNHRLAMTRLAVADDPASIVLTLETQRDPNRPSYTVETLDALHQALHPDATLRLLIGTDQMTAFPSWHQPERVIALAEPLVMLRAPQTADAALAAIPEPQRAAWADRLIELPPLDLSSTGLRNKLAHNQPTGDALAPAVRRYIQTHGLYPQDPQGPENHDS